MLAKTKKNNKSLKISLNKFKNIIANILLISFSVFLVGFLLYSNINIFKKKSDYQSKAEELQKEIAILEQKNEELRQGITHTENEDYKEEVIREQGYEKPGEQTIVVLPPQQKDEENIGTQKSFWEKVWDKIIFW